ncbi:acyl-CoA N-acyltransferase [Multifurca ochricompacta]|uniref:Acyl-CoA N-acyltransferase n=1 Tax=Multifurca ochricompacta TaxID=376703 RepID=A0AAD4LYJ0_9AGAM|nr:acyl-CoA N-acyltransferase [Multifurca ochricompacta]
MAYTNSYKPPDAPALLPGYYGPEPYDINWIFPLHEATLESERVKLTPFIPSEHAKEYAEQATAHPELHRWFPFDLPNLDVILTTVELRVRRDPTWILFAIIDKARGGALAGVIGLVYASPTNLSVEIAWVLVFPKFQRTYVTTNAVGIILQYCLELPTASPRPGLGLRRAQWMTHSLNKPSHDAAKRMGLKDEGILRWMFVLPEGKEGHGIPIREGDPQQSHPGRHSLVLSFCADDWENGGREHVQKLIDRK